MKVPRQLFVVAAVLAGSPIFAEVIGPPAGLHCTVKTIVPVNANFFTVGGRRPQVSDTIDLDLTANEITKLKFASGGTIPLEQAKAKLVKIPTPGEESYLTYYEGTHKSGTSDYIGTLSASHTEQNSYVNIQILRKEFLGPMTLHQLSMECTHLP